VIRVFVADDHAVVRRGLRQILEAEGMSVPVEGGTAEEVLSHIEERTTDVLVLDLSLPGSNGLDLLKEAKRRRPDLPVLILTVHSEDQYAVRALRAGASGYLTKDMAPEQLVEAIRKVYRGGRYVTAGLAERLVMHLHEDPEKAPHEALSNREFEVLRLIASGRTVSEAAEAMGLSVKTVSTYRTRILEKMSMKTNAELTHYAIRNGLVEDA
jgi:two-component system invasion response regulator UvrY